MRALLLSPHNDDEVLFASFLCLRYSPHVVICLKSFRMADPAYPAPQVDAKTRELETEFAMKTLGCQWTQWPIGDNPPSPDAVEGFMWGLRDPAGYEDWDVVIAPAWEEEGHDDHNLIASLTDTVFGDIEVIRYLTYTRSGRRSVSANEVEFEPEWIATKLHAMACYKSQAAHPATRAHFIDGGLREYLA